MTYPWASGEVLTAADLNAYAGLILVKTQTIGTAVSSVTVTGAFSSTFQNYRHAHGRHDQGLRVQQWLTPTHATN
jgi:hypothetical protein